MSYWELLTYKIQSSFFVVIILFDFTEVEIFLVIMPKLSNLVMGLISADSDRIIGKSLAIASVRAELKMG